jgi:protein involved in polysaccharide export with SLBB domain
LGSQENNRRNISSEEIPASQRLLSGDRLQISFYETLDVAYGDKSATADISDQVRHTFFQRIDLSAEYVINDSGNIMIPLLGWIKTEGHSIRTLRETIMGQFERVMGRQGDVSIAITKRQPIYVTGLLKNVGVFEFVPDMMVLHAVALAGGVKKEEIYAGRFAEYIRAKAEHTRARHQMKRLVAKHAALIARRDQLREVAPPERLVNMVGAEEARVLIERVTKLAGHNEGVAEAKRQALENRVDHQRNQVELLKKRLAEISPELETRRARYARMQLLLKRGITTSANPDAAHESFVVVKDRRDSIAQELANAEFALRKATSDLKQFGAGQRIELAKEISRIESELDDSEIELFSTQANKEMADKLFMQSGSDMRDVTYQVLRKSRAGPVSLDADQTTQLVPGDVLNVKLEPSLRKTQLSQKRYRNIEK